MVIGIDGNEANQEIRVGSGIYALEIIRQFRKRTERNLTFQVYLKDTILSDLPSSGPNFRYQIVRPRFCWTQFALPMILWKEKIFRRVPDLFFTPSHYAPRFSPIPRIITIFDLSFLWFPKMFKKKDLYQLKHWTGYSVKKAEKIITISEATKKDIINYYHLPEEKIIVAYPGWEKKRFRIRDSKEKIEKINQLRQKYKISGPYLLFLGTIQPRKNLARLLEAFFYLKSQRPNLKLVLGGMLWEGREGWGQKEIFQKIQSLKLSFFQDVLVTGYIPSFELPFLLAGATAFVLPSLYEGFGIPALEAMAVGIPVVASKRSSLPEVCGKAAIYIENPEDVQAIYQAIKRVLELTREEKRNLIQLGFAQAEKFSWEKTGEKIINVFLNMRERK